MNIAFFVGRWLAFALLGVLCSLPACSPQVAAQQNESENEIEQWVLQLAAAEPAVRQEAELKLLAIEEKSLPAVRAGMQSVDLEVSSRCKILFEKIQIRKRERISKLFLSDDYASKGISNFPAWPAFRDFVQNDDTTSRKLFLKMCDELPNVFVNHGIAGDKSAAALKKKARLVLVPAESQNVSHLASTIGYLFLVDQATKSQAGIDPKELFNNVETLESIRHFANYSHSQSIRKSEYRNVIESRLADWVNQWESLGRVPQEAKLKLIFQTSNMTLLYGLKENYESLSAEQRLKYLDIAFRATAAAEKDSWKICKDWLSKSLKDETIAVRSRVRSEPAKQIDVTIAMLAEGMMAKAIKKSLGTGEPIKGEPVFGSFPLSSMAYSIIRNEKDRSLLESYLR